ALQVALLNFFPTESGRSGLPRLIPFMPAPERSACDISHLAATQLCSKLDTYTKECVRLPPAIQHSAVWAKFFTVRTGTGTYDIDFADTPAPTQTPTSSTSTLSTPATRPLAIRRSGNQSEPVLFHTSIRISSTYTDLLRVLETRLRRRIEGLEYYDESGYLLPLHGDEDLGVLLRTFSGEVSLILT
ncbi:bud emergence protein 1, partial [Podochytrium sp. JEL0797]